MAFSTPGSEKRPDRTLLRLVIVVLALAASACSSSQQDFGIQLGGINATGTSNSLSIRANQDVRLSREARDALINGVPLRFRVDLVVRTSDGASNISEDSLVYEISYMPMSDHYQLSGPQSDATPQTFPRLRHVLSELQDIEWRQGGMNNEPGDYQFRLRSRLDRSGMPGAMQLPMLLTEDWDHDSGWISGEFQVSG